MSSKKLGDVRLHFSHTNGRFIGSTFKGCDLENLPKVADLMTSKDEKDLCKLAELVLANSFAIVNRIELADREKYKVLSVPQEVSRKDNGDITDITISFYLEEIEKTGSNGCPRCGGEPGEYHECPYGQEIDDDCTECNCCDKCHQDCADDI